ncbi:MAG: ribbon-helix-helix domain-containing protein [Thermosynechococcaceae cyanobacterium MS004]|nr:ribbon-helix-helix domain-containing protein [Thermosynechococcaceae cyanobacterium MS004]
MNFNICLEESLIEKLDYLSKQQGKTRNTIIREALEAWTTQSSPTAWPDIVLNYSGTGDSIIFESTRSELTPPKDVNL